MTVTTATKIKKSTYLRWETKKSTDLRGETKKSTDLRGETRKSTTTCVRQIDQFFVVDLGTGIE